METTTTMTSFNFRVGQKCMVEVHPHNYPNGVWEGVVEAVVPDARQEHASKDEPPRYLVTARFTDPRMLLETEQGAFTAPANYYGELVTADATLWPIETKSLFERIRRLREDDAARSTYYVAREKALLDAIRVAGKEAVAQAVGEAVQAAVKAAVREVFDSVKQSSVCGESR